MGAKRLNPEDWIGKSFGRLIVLGRYGRDDGPAGRLWRCLCSCGTYMETRLPSLLSGHTKSCGCIQFEHASQMNRQHGGNSARADPGVSLAYGSWYNMRHRCEYEKHESYPNYGGRGIKVCDRWKNFTDFLIDMGPAPAGYTLERHDNHGDYTKENCTWWPKRLQQINTRRNIRLEYQGQEWCLKRLCEKLNQNFSNVRYRYQQQGLTISRALFLTEGEVNELDKHK